MSLRLLLLISSMLVVRVAHADQLNGGKVKMELRLPPENGGSGFVAPTPTYLAEYFNLARCTCDKSGQAQSYQVRYTWATAPTMPVSKPLEIWVGSGCDNADPDVVNANCNKLDAITDPDALAQTVDRVYSVGELLYPKEASTCTPAERSAEHWAVTETSDAIWDADNKEKLGVTADLLAPPVPTTLTLKPLESGLKLEWEALTDRADDIAYYQALCAKADGTKAHSSTSLSAQYQTTRTLCSGTTDPDLPAATIAGDGGGPMGTLPTALAQLTPAYLCGEVSGAQARSISLTDLENGQGYWVVLVTVDKAGNVAGVHVDRPIVPQQVIDFWEELNGEDPYIQGGLCIASVDGRGDLGGALVIALALGAVVRRRRSDRSRRLAKLIALSLVLAPAVASAQVSYSPYWQEDDEGDLGMSVPTWTLGLRLGPYVPSIDAKFDSTPGPYARTFLNDSVMFAVDVHRVWPLLRGQLGVGVTAGYYSNSTQAWQDGTTPATPDRPRATDNLTRLSIVPTAITAIYRATIFDDEFGVPLVPYLRGGVAYDVWWIKTPADELSHHMSCPTCDDRALGGSIGVVGAVGLAVRAERIDPDAASSMQNSGLEHAGFFAELEMGWVDGFGNDKKLSVGDTTWFGGISSEF